MPCVVQLEFFHLPLNRTLDDLFSEARERVEDGVPLKTCLRVFDPGRGVLDLLQKAERLQKRDRVLHEQFAEAKGWYRTLLDYRISWMARRQLALRSRAHAWAVQRIEQAIRRDQIIGIEVLRGREWRLVGKDERHELCESVRKSAGAWVFMYECPDLFGVQQQLIAHCM